MNPTVALAEDGASAPGRFEFNVTFAPVDDLGRALAGVRVEFALEARRPNFMGDSNDEGELRLRWLGEQKLIRGTVSSTRDVGSTATNEAVLTAGVPNTVRFFADSYAKTMNAYSSKVVIHTPGDDPKLRSHDALFIAPPFEIDAAGNGVFTDPDLLALDGQGDAMYRSVESKAFTSRLVSRGSRPRDGMAKIEVLVHDPEGRAIPFQAPWRVFGGRGNEGRNPHTDKYGTFACMRQVLDPVELEVGGGIFTSVRKRFEFDADNAALSWDVELTRLPTIRGRIKDEAGKPLRSWRVQAREDHPPYGFLQACDTDGGGNFEIGLSGNSAVRLLVDTPGDADRPSAVLVEHQAATDQRIELVLQDAEPIKNFTWQISVPPHAIGALPNARVVRRDSLEGVVITPCDGARSPDGAWTWSFRLDRALPGSYTITCLVPGGRSSSYEQVAQGRSDFGPRPYPKMAHIVVPERVVDPDDRLTVRALEHAQGMRVRSNVLPFPSSYSTPEGDVELWITGVTSDGRSVKLRRNVNCNAGEHIELVLDELHPRAGTQAVSGPPR